MNPAEIIVLDDLEAIGKRLEPEARALAGKTVLITGGSGFLGQYLVLTLVHLNHTRGLRIRVVSLDNFITSSKKPLLKLQGYDDFTFIKHDVIESFSYPQSVDYVIHAAGIASPVYYQKYPVEAIEVASLGTKNFLELARKKHSKSFLFFSSSEIYGDPDPTHIPTAETYRGNVSSIGPRSPYDESKRLGEALSMAYWRKHRMPIKIIRPFNVFGPGMKQDDFRVIPAFFTSALQGESLRVHGQGTQTRTFCYVTDATVAFYKVLLSGKNGDVYNVGNDDNEISMLGLAQEVAQFFKGKIKAQTVPYPPEYPGDEPQRRAPDLTKIRKELAYKPQVNLREGLERTLTWFRAAYFQE